MKPVILVAEDEPINFEIVKSALADLYEVLHAYNGEEALKLAHSESPDLIILDVDMPVMNGHKACLQLKADDATSHIPVIFLTGRDDNESEAKGFKLGAVDYIAKPIVFETLLARVKTHLLLAAKQAMLQEMVSKRTVQIKKFAFHASHQVRRPLANLLGWLAALQDEMKIIAPPEHVMPILENIFRSSEELDQQLKKAAGYLNE